jgi:hypothetical protein
MAMVLDTTTLDQVIEMTNEILDAAGLKMLRPPWERNLEPKTTSKQKVTVSRR